MEGVPVRVVGFDCGEDWHVAVLLDEKGEVELRLDVRNRRDRIEEALAKLMLAIPEGARLQIAIESQRSHGRLVADVGGELGCEIWQVNTIALNHKMVPVTPFRHCHDDQVGDDDRAPTTWSVVPHADAGCENDTTMGTKPGNQLTTPPNQAEPGGRGWVRRERGEGVRDSSFLAGLANEA